jgi:aspartyl-tRNA(Asn)/glutamyl-tRNA(Gln) amidotransferase subunit A
VRTLIKADFDRAFEQVDALVTPTSPTVAFPLGARLVDPVTMYLADTCTVPLNVAGLPGISVPCGLSDGLPVGLQFMGRAWDERRLFGIARAYEAVTGSADWRRTEPTDLARASDPTTPAPTLPTV